MCKHPLGIIHAELMLTLVSPDGVPSCIIDLCCDKECIATGLRGVALAVLKAAPQ